MLFCDTWFHKDNFDHTTKDNLNWHVPTEYTVVLFWRAQEKCDTFQIISNELNW